MNRRHFISLSGASAAALLFSRITALSTGLKSVMNHPEKVELLLNDGWNTLTSSGGDRYAFRDAELSVQSLHDKLSVYLNSPSLPVKAIRLSWNHKTASDHLTLGDHWERSYGDMKWSSSIPAKKLPWYFLAHDAQSTSCFGVKTGCNTIAWWNAGPDTLELTLNTQSAGVGVLLGSRKLHAADIVTTKNASSENVFQTARRFCTIMCDNPRLPQKPVYGINDWYFTYGRNTPDLIMQQTRLLTDLATDNDNRPFSVIDAGWAEYSPVLPNDCCWHDDFSKPNEKFKDMHAMAVQIKSAGMRPGIWMRPLAAKHTDAGNLLLPKITGRGDAANPILDPTIEENIARVKNNISLYKEWGFELVKHDYSTYDITGRWGSQMNESFTDDGWKFSDNSRTTAEVIKGLYTSIREAAEDMYLIGCNTLSNQSAGIFELNRIGDDTSGREWDRVRKMGVNTMGFRMSQHNTFYAADGDCVGLTKEIPWKKNKQWMQLVAESSAPLFISVQPEAIGAEQKAFIKECFTKAAKPQPVGEPLDWMDQQRPSKWKLDDREVTFDWS